MANGSPDRQPVGRGQALDDALRAAFEFQSTNPKPRDGADGRVAWDEAARPFSRAVREAARDAPLSALVTAAASDWRNGFKAAESGKNMREAALALATFGFLIFPCNVDHKGPHTVLGTLGGAYWATDDPVAIEGWWSKAPDAAIGLLMGRRTGVFAVDIDIKAGGHADDGMMSFRQLTADLCPIGGRVHMTAGGGEHRLFKWFDGGPVHKMIPLKIGDKAYPGVEIIGDNAYIIIPPSKVKGGTYSVAEEKLPPEAPKKLKDALGAKKENVHKIKEQPEPAADVKWDPKWCAERLREAVDALLATVRGTYDITSSVALKIGSIVAGGGLNDADAWEALSEAASGADKPRDYREKVRRAYEKGKENPWAPQKQFLRWPDWGAGRPSSTFTNTVVALDNLDMVAYFNEMTHRIVITYPGREVEVKDAEMLDIRATIRKKFGFDPGEKPMREAMVHSAHRLPIHPYREYLEDLKWDGKRRLKQLFPVYFGTDDTLYTRVIGIYFVMGIVARAYRPGCKMDYTVILEGLQGEMKSMACRALVSEQYFAGNMPSIKQKDALEQLQGKMLIELAEIVALLHENAELLKAFLTNQTDRFRVSYGTHSEDFARTVTFIGTTNQHHIFDDITGARRFWPVKVGRINLKALTRDRDQLFAEAVERFKRGRPWWPSRRLEAKVFVPEQEARQEVDDREAIIQAWICDEAARLAGGATGLTIHEIWENRDYRIRGFTAFEVWTNALGMRADIPFETRHSRPIRNCLIRLGCTQYELSHARRYWLPPKHWVLKDNSGDPPF